MISLKAFVDAVHDAVVAANDTLTDSSVGIIAKFFKKTPAEDDSESAMIPDSIILKYPRITEKGVEEVDVNVPLLTLAPLTCPTIDTVEFETRFEMEIMENELQLNFSKDNKDTTDIKSNRSGHLKIKISPQEIPEGLKSVIEGYERILKSQIP